MSGSPVPGGEGVADGTSGLPLGLEELRRRAAEIGRLARKHRARRVRVVGSVARGDASAGSNLDLLVDFQERASSFDVGGCA